MNLYLLTAIGRVDYDEFDSFAVVAANEDDARQLIASSLRLSSQDASTFTVRRVDLATEPAGILCSSFNAG